MNLHVLPWLLAVWDNHKEASQYSAFSGIISTKDFLLCPFSYFPPYSLYHYNFPHRSFKEFYFKEGFSGGKLLFFCGLPYPSNKKCK